jgi:sugar phosphate isomerase/epimerase
VPMLSVPQRLGLQRAGEDGSAYWERVSKEMTADDWRHVAAQLNEKGAALKREGLKLGYHNHNVELTRLGSKTPLDLLIENTDPGLVWFEMDAGWVAAGGLEPIPLLRAHPHRFRLMHIKDLKASTVFNAALRMDPANVGSGTLDWKAILPVAYEAGVRYYYVEQEPPFVEPRMQAAREDYDFLARLS